MAETMGTGCARPFITLIARCHRPCGWAQGCTERFRGAYRTRPRTRKNVRYGDRNFGTVNWAARTTCKLLASSCFWSAIVLLRT